MQGFKKYAMISEILLGRNIMSEVKNLIGKIKEIWAKAEPTYRKIEEVITVIIRCVIKLRKVILAAPVIYYAVKIAGENMDRLPETVGFNLQANGEFAAMVSRNYAVYGPLAVTMFCLLLMFSSRKTLFPWIISIFTLVLPYLIYYTNLIM